MSVSVCVCVSACVDFYLFADAAGLRWSPRRRLLNGYQWKAINAALIYCNLISFPFGHLRVFYIANYVQTRLGRGQRLAAPKVGVGRSPPTGLFIVCRTWFTRLSRLHKKLAINFVYSKSRNTLYIRVYIEEQQQQHIHFVFYCPTIKCQRLFSLASLIDLLFSSLWAFYAFTLSSICSY